jgi:hypothetical protein
MFFQMSAVIHNSRHLPPFLEFLNESSGRARHPLTMDILKTQIEKNQIYQTLQLPFYPEYKWRPVKIFFNSLNISLLENSLAVPLGKSWRSCYYSELQTTA